jgi:hypothetical protein
MGIYPGFWIKVWDIGYMMGDMGYMVWDDKKGIKRVKNMPYIYIYI